ncbi:MAG: acyl-CoA dehydrogenase family protein [Bradymonadia bacterium]|jgi:isovaleryl-CoA dehydrogenase
MNIFDSTPTHVQLRDTLRSWVIQNLAPMAAERDQSGEFDRRLFDALASELGLVGMSVSEKLGGLGLDLAALLMVFEELAYADASFALSFLAHELLFLHQLAENLSNDVQRHYLKTPIASLAMTEPHSGTDVLDMRTTASPVEGGYVINGEKQWISNAPLAEAFLVFAKTGEGRKDISLFLLDRSCDGLSVGKAEDKMGMRSSPTASVYLDQCRVGGEYLVGPFNGALSLMMKNLAIERLGLAAISCGIAKAAFDEMKSYAAQRRAFGRTIAEFGQIQSYIAKSHAELAAARALIYSCATSGVAGLDQTMADSSKLFASTTGERVCRRAIQCMGANGYSKDYAVERYYRDAVLLSIGGGTNEALQKNIVRALSS